MAQTVTDSGTYLGSGQVPNRYQQWATENRAAFKEIIRNDQAKELAYCKICKGWYPALCEECPDASNH